MKKFLSIMLSILMVVTMLPMSVMPASAATPTPYDGVPVTPQKISSSNYAKLGLTSSNWSQFNGYYAIRNAKELYGFASIVSKTANTQGTNAVLLQDIVVNANSGTTYDWSPIADQTDGHNYEGIFDGNGHYISGLYSTKALMPIASNNKKCGGFICNLLGTVKNLVIKNSTFSPGMDLGFNGGLGAITGYPFDCTIQNCRVENITLKSINDGGQLGGIAGYGNGNSSTIKNCVSINVTFSGGKYTDPIAPKAPYSSCYTSATASHNCTNLSVEHKEVKATCEYPGLSNYKYCLVCGKVTSGTKTETPATGHTLKSATCIAPKTCTICGATEGSIDNTAHSWANNDGICANGCGATCAHKNQTGSVCEICGATIRFATITGVSINVDGVIYTSDNTSAENPAVINPDSVVTITVTGENFDLLPAGPENAVIGFTYFSQNLEWLYNNPSKFDIDTVNNTVSFPANYNVLSQATTASELTYTNDDWYTDIGSGVYVIYIDKKDIADTFITLDNTEFIYSGNPIEPTVLVMADGQALMEGEHYTLTFESNVNAGTAIVTVKGIGDYTGEVTKDFTITKAYYDLTAPTPDTLKYNGENQYLVSAGTVEGADFEYSLDGISWSTSIPQAKDVGSYTVYYRVLADENHYGIEGTVDVTIKECTHEWGEGVLTRPVYDAVLGSKDGYYTYTCTLCCEEKTETVKSADYSAYEAVSEEINALLQSEELTPEAKQAIYSAANECGHLSNDLTESEQNIVDDLVAELEKIVADAEEKIASGEYVKADYTEIDEAIASVDEALENATISEEMANELSDIKSQLEALKENKNTSMADAAELLERVKAVAETMADCANGIHSFTKYEETEAPECGKAGKEVASCDHGCGATDENEIPALTHKDEDGDLKCDHGCGHEFPKPVEPEQPDTPDEPEQPEEDGTICEYCGSNHNNPITRIFCRITQFFIRLFTFLGYWE